MKRSVIGLAVLSSIGLTPFRSAVPVGLQVKTYGPPRAMRLRGQNPVLKNSINRNPNRRSK